MNKIGRLESRKKEIKECKLCTNAGWGDLVFGEGDPDAEVRILRK